MKRHEKEHYQALSDEWTKRMAENEANYQRKLKDLDATQVRLMAEMKKHQAARQPDLHLLDWQGAVICRHCWRVRALLAFQLS